ncbi:MAG: hypothetical protein Q7K42_06035 [Candidatus Diapherotrites archaeon]|nr:hypothetical protein [Candidatus Diapherotrites archaeon]
MPAKPVKRKFWHRFEPHLKSTAVTVGFVGSLGFLLVREGIAHGVRKIKEKFVRKK